MPSVGFSCFFLLLLFKVAFSINPNDRANVHLKGHPLGNSMASQYSDQARSQQSIQSGHPSQVQSHHQQLHQNQLSKPNGPAPAPSHKSANFVANGYDGSDSQLDQPDKLNRMNDKIRWVENTKVTCLPGQAIYSMNWTDNGHHKLNLTVRCMNVTTICWESCEWRPDCVQKETGNYTYVRGIHPMYDNMRTLHRVMFLCCNATGRYYETKTKRWELKKQKGEPKNCQHYFKNVNDQIYRRGFTYIRQIKQDGKSILSEQCETKRNFSFIALCPADSMKSNTGTNYNSGNAGGNIGPTYINTNGLAALYAAGIVGLVLLEKNPSTTKAPVVTSTGTGSTAATQSTTTGSSTTTATTSATSTTISSTTPSSTSLSSTTQSSTVTSTTLSSTTLSTTTQSTTTLSTTLSTTTTKPTTTTTTTKPTTTTTKCRGSAGGSGKCNTGKRRRMRRSYGSGAV